MSKKNIASQDAARVIAGTAQCVQALLKAGLTLEDFQRINDDRLVREKLVHYWKSEGESVLEVPNFTSQAEAREIMGENFLGLPEVRRNYGLTKEHSEALLEVPFSPTALQSCQYTHVLVADMGFSIMDIRSLLQEKWTSYDSLTSKGWDGFNTSKHRQLNSFVDWGWYRGEDFVAEIEIPCWRLIGKNPLNSFKELESRNSKLPKARALIYASVLLSLARGKMILKDCYARTESLTCDGESVLVGSFDSYGIGLDRGAEQYLEKQENPFASERKSCKI